MGIETEGSACYSKSGETSKEGFLPDLPEVPILDGYSVNAGQDYWDIFPVNQNGCGGSPFKIDVKKLEEHVKY